MCAASVESLHADEISDHTHRPSVGTSNPIGGSRGAATAIATTSPSAPNAIGAHTVSSYAPWTNWLAPRAAPRIARPTTAIRSVQVADARASWANSLGDESDAGSTSARGITSLGPRDGRARRTRRARTAASALPIVGHLASLSEPCASGAASGSDVMASAAFRYSYRHRPCELR